MALVPIEGLAVQVVLLFDGNRLRHKNEYIQ